MTKPHAQAKSGSARTAQSAIQKDILPLEQMMAHEVSSNLGADTQSEPQLISNDSKDNVWDCSDRYHDRDRTLL